MRVDAQLQGMGQHHQIQAARRKGQRHRVGQQVRGHLAFSAPLQRQPLVLHAVGPQARQHWQTQLQAVVAKNIRYRLVEARLLPRQQILARR